MKKKTLLVLTFTVIIVLISLSVGGIIAEHQILYHFSVVDEGKVYRSGTLSELGLKWAKHKSGFKTIINLRSQGENNLPWYKQEKQFAKDHNLQLIDLPLQTDTPPTAEEIAKFLKIINNPENLPVIIHCHQGVTRTAMMVAVYEIAIRKKDNLEVYDNVEKFDHSFEKKDKIQVKKFILNFGGGESKVRMDYP